MKQSRDVRKEGKKEETREEILYLNKEYKECKHQTQ